MTTGLEVDGNWKDTFLASGEKANMKPSDMDVVQRQMMEIYNAQSY